MRQKREWRERWRGVGDICQRQEEVQTKEKAGPGCGGSPGPDGEDVQVNVKMTGDGTPFHWPPFIELYYWQC